MTLKQHFIDLSCSRTMNNIYDTFWIIFRWLLLKIVSKGSMTDVGQGLHIKHFWLIKEEVYCFQDVFRKAQYLKFSQYGLPNFSWFFQLQKLQNTKKIHRPLSSEAIYSMQYTFFCKMNAVCIQQYTINILGSFHCKLCRCTF